MSHGTAADVDMTVDTMTYTVGEAVAQQLTVVRRRAGNHASVGSSVTGTNRNHSRRRMLRDCCRQVSCSVCAPSATVYS